MAELPLNQIIQGDALDVAKSLPDASVDCCLSSPPYFLLRNYGVEGQWGSEATIDEYLAHLWALYAEVFRALKPTGTCFVNLGDTYMNDPGGQNGGANNTPDYGAGRISAKIVEANRQAGRQDRRGVAPVPKKSLMLIPERFAIGMVERGWICRNKLAWWKPNAMPSSATDRFAATWEHVWFFTKRERYWSDLDAVRVPTAGALERPQYRRALELAEAGGLTQEHLAAIRASGITDAGKARETQTGTDKNSERVRELAAQAKAVLGGYWREFLGPVALQMKRSTKAPTLEEMGGNHGRSGPDGNGMRMATVYHNPLGRNPGDLWQIPTQPLPEAHFAVWPEELARRIIRFGCPPDGVAWDPFVGSGTTALVALHEGRNFVGSELSPDYIAIAEKRIARETGWAKRQPLPLEETVA